MPLRKPDLEPLTGPDLEAFLAHRKELDEEDRLEAEAEAKKKDGPAP